jgi:hypothetical protein
MKAKKPKRFWKIILIKPGGYDEVIAKIPFTHITKERLVALLETLLVKHFLKDDEIVRAHLKRNVKGHCQPYSYVASHGQASDRAFTHWFAIGSSGTHATLITE